MPSSEEEKVSDLHHALRASRRRHVVRLLHRSQEITLTTRELAREIAAMEQFVAPSHATGEPYRNVYNALSQTHLPTLAEADIVIYDPERQRVSRGPNLLIAAVVSAVNEAAIDAILRDTRVSPRR
jgi:DNA-binding transcriptional ArsR family regulator